VTPRNSITNIGSPTPGAYSPTYWSQTATPLGSLYIATTNQGLCAIKFGRLEPDLETISGPHPGRDREISLADLVRNQLQEYFSMRRRVFDLPLDLSALTPFQAEVLAATSRIPWGEAWSYQRIASELARPKSSRPVGQALGRNPIPIIIPCHRVIASDGNLGGYCGKVGLDLKRWLLRHEGTQL